VNPDTQAHRLTEQTPHLRLALLHRGVHRQRGPHRVVFVRHLMPQARGEHAGHGCGEAEREQVRTGFRRTGAIPCKILSAQQDQCRPCQREQRAHNQMDRQTLLLVEQEGADDQYH
jgi:hypothetical protein